MVKAATMLLESVESSQMDRVGYNSGIMIVEFKGGTKYLYVGVDKFTYDSMMSAPSVGSFFSKNIKNDESIKCIKLEF